IISILFAISLTISIFYQEQAQAQASADVTVQVDPTARDGSSTLSLGVTHTHFMWEEGDSAAVNSAKKLLVPAVKFQNQHIMGFGADNPQPTAGGPFNF